MVTLILFLFEIFSFYKKNIILVILIIEFGYKKISITNIKLKPIVFYLLLNTISHKHKLTSKIL